MWLALASNYCQSEAAFADGLILAYGNRSLTELAAVVQAVASAHLEPIGGLAN